MKIAIMQPYLFPYIGYFQLINSVNKFVFYDDVNYIKQGWINRNKILINDNELLFTVPLKKANSFCLIKDTLINNKFYDGWLKKFNKTIDQNYKKAPYFDEVKYLISSIFNRNNTSISNLAIDSVITISNYLDLETKFLISSENYNNKDLERQDRLFAICQEEKAKHYVNPHGGKELYTKESFEENGINLRFIKPLEIKYEQFNNEFIPWLSIIDVLMFNSKEKVKEMLNQYELV